MPPKTGLSKPKQASFRVQAPYPEINIFAPDVIDGWETILSFWENLFSGAMLVPGNDSIWNITKTEGESWSPCVKTSVIGQIRVCKHATKKVCHQRIVRYIYLRASNQT